MGKLFSKTECRITGVVASVKRGDPHGLQVWGDKEKDPDVVVVSADQSQSKNTYYKKLAFVYSRDNNLDTLGKVLHSPGVLDLNSEIHFRDVYKPTYDAVESILSHKNGKVKPITDILDLFEIKSATEIPELKVAWFRYIMCSPVYNVTCLRPSMGRNSVNPEDLRFGELTPEIAQKAANLWVFKGPEIIQYYLDQQQWGYEAFLVYNGNDKSPIAWSVQNFYGPILGFYIAPEARRCGVGKTVAIEISNRICKNYGRVLGLVERWNKIASSNIKVAGFKKVKGVEFVYNVIDFSKKV